MPTCRPLALAAALAALTLGSAARAADLRIALTQAQAGDSRKYQPLLAYLAGKGLAVSFVTAPDYPAAADLFAKGGVEAMFGGSGIAGTMMIKGLADPLVRQVTADGAETYSAVVLAPAGAPRFDGSARYFEGKRVIFTPLASAGEFYFRSLGPSKPAALLRATSHGAAVDALARGQADVAIVKNAVWEKEKAKFPGVALVGADPGANPENSLIVSRRLDPQAARRLADALVGLERDPGPQAAAAREALKIRGFVAATPKDFAHTLATLKKCGVTSEFAFAF